jgi:phytoene synthase
MSASAALQEAYRHCEALVRAEDHDRFLASLFAPAHQRPHLHALHAFNGEIVRVGHVVREALAGEVRLQWWRDALAGEARGEAAANPVAAALTDTIARCDLPRAPFDALIDAHAHALYGEPVATLAELETFARATGSGLFGLAARILDQTAAVDAVANPGGVAYALAGSLQAFAREAARGRTLLPLDLLERYGLRHAQAIAGAEAAKIRSVLLEIAERATELLGEASRAWSVVSPATRPAFLPLALVKPLLAQVERNRDPLRSRELAPWRRQSLLWRAARRGAL